MFKPMKYALPVILSMSIFSDHVTTMSLSKDEQDEQSVHSFAVYTLSRGKGVPEAARTILQDSGTLVESLRQKGHDIKITQQRIGLEGETRLCVEFSDTKLASATLQKIRILSQDEALVNVVEEPCKPHQAP